MKYVIYTGPFRFPIGDAAAARVLNNGKLFRLLGYKVVFVSWGGCYREEDRDVSGNYFYDGFQYVVTKDIDVKRGIVKRILYFLLAGKNALTYIKGIISNADIIIAYNSPLYTTNILLNLCEKNKIPLISDLTEWYSPNELPGGKFAPPAWLNEYNMSILQKKVKNKIVISSFLNEYYSASNNIILPPLIDKDEPKWKSFNSVLPEYDGIRILYAGNPSKKDLLETILNAVLECVRSGLKLQFVMVGVSENNTLGYNNHKDFALFPDNIIFCGNVPQTKVPSYFKVSDFSIIIRKPNRKNSAGFPTKLVESMMAGCPVITNSTSDIPKYIIHGKNGLLVAKWSSNEVKKTLKFITTINRSNLIQMKYMAMECALKHFNYSCHVEKASDFVKNIN